jgi:hypothetical protein
MALTSDRNCPRTKGEIISIKVATAVKIFAGALVAINSDGYLVPASDTAGLKVIGIAEEAVDNSSGSNGDISAKVLRCAAKLGNSATSSVTQAKIGSPVYVVDDETVGATSTNSVVAGIAIELENGDVWVDVSSAPAIKAAVDLAATATAAAIEAANA